MDEQQQKPVKVTVGVCGGIAAYKAVELVRLLQDAGLDPHVVMTASAQQFVPPSPSPPSPATPSSPGRSPPRSRPPSKNPPSSTSPRPSPPRPGHSPSHGLLPCETSPRHRRRLPLHHLPRHHRPRHHRPRDERQHVEPPRHPGQPRHPPRPRRPYRRPRQRLPRLRHDRRRPPRRVPTTISSHPKGHRGPLARHNRSNRPNSPRHRRRHPRTHRPRPLHRQPLQRPHGLRPRRRSPPARSSRHPHLGPHRPHPAAKLRTSSRNLCRRNASALLEHLPKPPWSSWPPQ